MSEAIPKIETNTVLPSQERGLPVAAEKANANGLAPEGPSEEGASSKVTTEAPDTTTEEGMSVFC